MAGKWPLAELHEVTMVPTGSWPSNKSFCGFEYFPFVPQLAVRVDGNIRITSPLRLQHVNVFILIVS